MAFFFLLQDTAISPNSPVGCIIFSQWEMVFRDGSLSHTPGLDYRSPVNALCPLLGLGLAENVRAKERTSKSVHVEPTSAPNLLHKITAGGISGTVPVVLADPLSGRTCWSHCPLAAGESSRAWDKPLTPSSSSENWISPTFTPPSGQSRGSNSGLWSRQDPARWVSLRIFSTDFPAPVPPSPLGPAALPAALV